MTCRLLLADDLCLAGNEAVDKLGHGHTANVRLCYYTELILVLKCEHAQSEILYICKKMWYKISPGLKSMLS